MNRVGGVGLMGPHDGSARLGEPRSDSMDTPLSILVCVRNRADLTRSFLDTLLPTIDKASAELLVYDDLSTDGTPALLEACAQNEGASLGGGTTIVRGDAPGCFGATLWESRASAGLSGTSSTSRRGTPC